MKKKVLERFSTEGIEELVYEKLSEEGWSEDEIEQFLLTGNQKDIDEIAMEYLEEQEILESFED